MLLANDIALLKTGKYCTVQYMGTLYVQYSKWVHCTDSTVQYMGTQYTVQTVQYMGTLYVQYSTLVHCTYSTVHGYTVRTVQYMGTLYVLYMGTLLLVKKNGPDPRSRSKMDRIGCQLKIDRI